jgi:deoxyribodipyrimidine photolyase-related protein
MDGDEPVGGRWNFDPENRGSFPKSGPQDLPRPRSFPPDGTTKEVLRLVERKFPDPPGRLDHFDWPLTPRQAQSALKDFIEHRLPLFGEYQDAIWQGEPFLYHAQLSAALNLKLLDPRDVLREAEAAYHAGQAPINAVEGFVRQILGWREYVRGVYWHLMPEYLERNHLEADRSLPKFYWTGETDMNCLKDTITQTLDYGYAHHIQRLMVTGLFALLLGVDPREVHEWYLAVYVDAVEWVELPNTLGMSQYADGGVMASKPYAASGKYIKRMSNYCGGCRFRPDRAVGEDACPFSTLYWDFLMRHEKRLAGNNRMTMQLKNLARKSPSERAEIRRQAGEIMEACS